MKTRQKDRHNPPPEDPWNEVGPRLWMGGHIRVGADGEEPVVVGREFDLVLSLYQREGHGPAPGVEHHFAEMPDGPLTEAQLADVERFVGLAVAAVRAGRTTLVRCHAGQNRSGLVVAQALVELGLGVPAAIERVRQRRSPGALSNQLFVQYLESGLPTARLLAGLGS
ncbi:protein-tyrosine phosphatase family protein [Amycolatopsis tolypomycina]|uniref:Dual specificity phosphatase, catalytic domain n=1 Tax=Amycolatopsis tolypomycina TaxID=208445 RepID=A0A1H4J560_9PSEU|nr:dual specificity protein phosphatase family protein [Amycolatopsis tolypomycina]SEB41096.1 Dual specificity phosphatase, catalytic domain [Amycolatopsis tolypomycina]